VEARSTVLYAQPGGETTLVRFEVHDAQVPAGRLRVYDGARRLLGTAGLLGTGDHLYGELWLPLEGDTRIVTELELPNRRGVIRGEHRLRTQPRWTLYWIAVADAARLLERLESLLPWQRAIEIALLRETAVGGNPLAVQTPLELLDHIPFLRIGQPARDLEDRFGIPVSPVAVGPEEHLRLRASASSLAGGGTGHACFELPRCQAVIPGCSDLLGAQAPCFAKLSDYSLLHPRYFHPHTPTRERSY
jgi:hypothetical protein